MLAPVASMQVIPLVQFGSLTWSRQAEEAEMQLPHFLPQGIVGRNHPFTFLFIHPFTSYRVLTTSQVLCWVLGIQWRELDTVTALRGLYSRGEDGCQSNLHILLNKIALAQSKES